MSTKVTAFLPAYILEQLDCTHNNYPRINSDVTNVQSVYRSITPIFIGRI